MIENQEKYGYIYVDTTGTVVQVSHPTPGGHRHIANRILEELPDARFQYKEDVSIRNADYKAIEYVTLNGYMSGTTEATFSPDVLMTKEMLTSALNKITGDCKISDSTVEVTKFDVAYNIFKYAQKKDIASFIGALQFAFEIIDGYEYKITRGDAASILYYFVKNFV